MLALPDGFGRPKARFRSPTFETFNKKNVVSADGPIEEITKIASVKDAAE